MIKIKAPTFQGHRTRHAVQCQTYLATEKWFPFQQMQGHVTSHMGLWTDLGTERASLVITTSNKNTHHGLDQIPVILCNKSS